MILMPKWVYENAILLWLSFVGIMSLLASAGY